MHAKTSLGKISGLLKHTLFVFATLFAVACSGNGNANQDVSQTTEKTESSRKQKPSKLLKKVEQKRLNKKQRSDVPQKVYNVLSYVKETGRAPEGYQGGRKFGNFEKHLPLKDESGILMKYQEWDVNPKKQGKNRGAERLITSKNKHAWYTRDHYNSFIEIE